MPLSATGRAAARAELSPHTLACTSDGVWLWPATPLTERRGGVLVPLPTPQLFALVATLHGPRLHAVGVERALHAAALRLNAGRIAEAESVLAALALPPVTLEGEAVMKAIARRLAIVCPDVAVAGPPLAPSSQIVIALAQVHDRKLAEARRLESAFNPDLAAGRQPMRLSIPRFIRAGLRAAATAVSSGRARRARTKGPPLR